MTCRTRLIQNTFYLIFRSCETPKLIEALQGFEIVDIACGGAHSAAITAAGHLFTWGKGRYGRLGHGDSEDQLKPKLVYKCYNH